MTILCSFSTAASIDRLLIMIVCGSGFIIVTGTLYSGSLFLLSLSLSLSLTLSHPPFILFSLSVSTFHHGAPLRFTRCSGWRSDRLELHRPPAVSCG